MKVLFEHGNFALLFEPRDLWIGVRKPHKYEKLVVYICIVPMFPIRYKSPYWVKAKGEWHE
jgi:hypothetical protein